MQLKRNKQQPTFFRHPCQSMAHTSLVCLHRAAIFLVSGLFCAWAVGVPHMWKTGGTLWVKKAKKTMSNNNLRTDSHQWNLNFIKTAIKMKKTHFFFKNIVHNVQLQLELHVNIVSGWLQCWRLQHEKPISTSHKHRKQEWQHACCFVSCTGGRKTSVSKQLCSVATFVYLHM